MNKFTVRDLTVQVMIATIYVALVLAFHWVSYGDYQFRVAEILLILVFFNPKHAIGLILGTFVANLFSPFGILDSLVGTLATILAIIPMIFLKKRWYLAIIIPAITNGILVSMLNSIVGGSWIGYWQFALTVFIGELAVMLLLGIPFHLFTNRNKEFQQLIK